LRLLARLLSRTILKQESTAHKTAGARIIAWSVATLVGGIVWLGSLVLVLQYLPPSPACSWGAFGLWLIVLLAVIASTENWAKPRAKSNQSVKD
jgi:hypothetical protein